jgi:hypothetical protein
MKRTVNQIFPDLEEYLTTVYIKTITKDEWYKTKLDRTGFFHRLDERDLWLLSQGEYTRSSLISELYDGGIYFINEPIPHTHRICEELVDSRGQKHSVQIDYESRSVILQDDFFKLSYDGHVTYTEKCPIEVDYLSFQFNLKNYLLLLWLGGFSPLSYYRNLVYNLRNDFPDSFGAHHYKRMDGMEATGWAPFWEHCYGRGETNYIPDELFFNVSNRKLALERVICGPYDGSYQLKDIVFNGFDFINADDHDLISFMNDRFQRRIKYEQYLNTNHYYLT